VRAPPRRTNAAARLCRVPRHGDRIRELLDRSGPHSTAIRASRTRPTRRTREGHSDPGRTSTTQRPRPAIARRLTKNRIVAAPARCCSKVRDAGNPLRGAADVPCPPDVPPVDDRIVDPNADRDGDPSRVMVLIVEPKARSKSTAAASDGGIASTAIVDGVKW
jgi:hypothetical protein